MEGRNVSGENVSINEYSMTDNILKKDPFSYWSTFSTPPSEHYYIIGIFMTFISIFGTLSNGFVLFSFTRWVFYFQILFLKEMKVFEFVQSFILINFKYLQQASLLYVSELQCGEM